MNAVRAHSGAAPQGAEEVWAVSSGRVGGRAATASREISFFSLGHAARLCTLLTVGPASHPASDMPEHVTGLEKRERDAMARGEELFGEASLHGPFGTPEAPVVVKVRWSAACGERLTHACVSRVCSTRASWVVLAAKERSTS